MYHIQIVHTTLLLPQFFSPSHEKEKCKKKKKKEEKKLRFSLSISYHDNRNIVQLLPKKQMKSNQLHNK